MSRRIELPNITVIEIVPTPDEKCDLCGKIDELRPYGPKGENICFECGMKDEAGTTARMASILFGVSPSSEPSSNA